MTTFEVHDGGLDLAADAAAWVVRLSSETADVADLDAFDVWLNAGPGRAEAYDRALAAWTQADALASAPRSTIGPLVKPMHARRWMAVGAMAAAVVAGVLVLASVRPSETYVTGAGERRQVALADGSRVDLNAGTRMSVRWSRDRRDVDLVAGEAAFDVAKDAARPFVIRSGARSVRVVGTEFDVKARGETFSVAVRRGVVEVRGGAGAPPVRLIRGDALMFADAGVVGRKVRVDPDDAFTWKEGRLVFRDAALSDVVDALNQQFGAPGITIEPQAGRLRFSGVLRLDGRTAVVHRLTQALPVSARETSSGIVLKMASANTP